MKLPILALLERSLRLEARSRLMCVARMALPGVILFSLVYLAAVARYGYFGAPGLHLFQTVVWINFVFISLAGLSYFASAITEEKEEMMLGLLRMTNLSPVAILLGKSTSRLLGAVMLLLVQFPFTLLAVTLGGVSPGQIVAAYCALGAYIVLLCNLALLWSVVFRRTVAAATVTAVTLGIWWAGPPLALESMNALASDHKLDLAHGAGRVFLAGAEGLRDSSPITAFGPIMSTGFPGGWMTWQVIANLAGAVVLFLLAWLAFEPCTREQHEEAPVRGRMFMRRRRRARVPTRVAGARAITWKEYTFLAGGPGAALTKFVAVGIALAGFCCAAKKVADIDWSWVGWFVAISSLVVAGITLAVDASRVFRHEVRWKTLSTLMILPVSVSELAYRQVAGCLLGTIPYLAWFVIGVLLIPREFLGFLRDLVRDEHSMGLSVFLIGAMQYLFFLHLTAYLSLVLKRGALPLAFAIQYGGMLVVFPMMMFAFGSISRESEMMVWMAIVISVATLILHVRIGRRLQRVAAEE